MKAQKHLESFATIAAKAQYVANQRGGDYAALSFDELCDFMVAYDAALTKAENDDAVIIPAKL